MRSCDECGVCIVVVLCHGPAYWEFVFNFNVVVPCECPCLVSIEEFGCDVCVVPDACWVFAKDVVFFVDWEPSDEGVKGAYDFACVCGFYVEPSVCGADVAVDEAFFGVSAFVVGSPECFELLVPFVFLLCVAIEFDEKRWDF